MSENVNIQAFLAGLARGGELQRRATLRALGQFASHVVGDSQELAPVDTGALKASGMSLPPADDGGSITCTIGHNTDYAAAVHERLDQHHEQGQAKYLDAAMRKNADKLAPFVAARVREATNGGGNG